MPILIGLIIIVGVIFTCHCLSSIDIGEYFCIDIEDVD
jgi:hypothetical protein